MAVVLGIFGAVNVRADALVSVSAFSLSPNPVNIVTGEAVYWIDSDGGGPYGIYSSTGQFNTETDSNGILFDQPGTYGYYDDNGNIGSIHVALNLPPSVTILTPTNQTQLAGPATFQFSVDASDTDADGLSDVEFYVGTNLVDDVFSPPFTTTITNLPNGTYTLTAIAYDNVFTTATNTVTITVSTLAPTLIAKRFGNQLVVSWETNNAAGLSLQSCTNLNSGAGWITVPIIPTPVGSQLTVTNPIVGAKQFFRLSNH
jgi:hypothetical protein